MTFLRRAGLQFLLVASFSTGSSFADDPGLSRESPEDSPTFSLPVQVKAKEGVAKLKGGANLWYWDTGGEGPVIILMHAGTMSGAAWPFQQPVFAREGYRVIGYSRRNYYKSSSRDSNLGVASKDLLELMDFLEVGKAHIIAAAHGGSFATDFVLSYPQRVESLVLMSSLIGIDEPEYRAMLNRILPPFFSSLPADFKELSPSYRASHPEGVKAWNLIAQQARNRNAFGAPQRQHRVTWKKLQTISVPVLIVGGEADLYAPPPLLKLQKANLPTSKLVLIPEVGHSANWEAPDTFNKIVLSFYKSLKSPHP